MVPQARDEKIPAKAGRRHRPEQWRGSRGPPPCRALEDQAQSSRTDGQQRFVLHEPRSAAAAPAAARWAARPARCRSRREAEGAEAEGHREPTAEDEQARHDGEVCALNCVMVFSSCPIRPTLRFGLARSSSPILFGRLARFQRGTGWRLQEAMRLTSSDRPAEAAPEAEGIRNSPAADQRRVGGTSPDGRLEGERMRVEDHEATGSRRDRPRRRSDCLRFPAAGDHAIFP